jgi:hypothetical protein
MPPMGYAGKFYLKMPLGSDETPGIALGRQISDTDFPLVTSRIRSTYAGIPHPSDSDAHWRLSHRMPAPGRRFWVPSMIRNRFLSQFHPYPAWSASIHASFRIATRGVMEILGLVPSNPRRNTSKENFECRPIGNIVEICFHFPSYLPEE